MVETLLLSWVLVILLAAIYQLYLMNHTVFRSLTAVHQELFYGAYQSNCFQNTLNCTYDGGDLRSKVIWRPQDIPEVQIPVVDFFGRAGLAGGRLTSNSPMHNDDLKRTKLGAGTYQPPFETLGWAFGHSMDPVVWTGLFQTLTGLLTNPVP